MSDPVLEMTCSMAVCWVISDSKFQTGSIWGQLKNLCVEFWEGWLQREHFVDSRIFP